MTAAPPLQPSALERHLRAALPGAPPETIGHDAQGQPRLLSTPPLARAHMSPAPWALNPLRRWWAGQRGLRPQQPRPHGQPDAPDARPLSEVQPLPVAVKNSQKVRLNY